jgi:hypothetical protein
MKINGACHCGAITVEGEADPAKVTVCHCTDCQNATGTAFRVTIPVEGYKLTITGTPQIYLKTTADSGNPRAHGFCPTCGTPIFATTPGEGKQAVYGVRVGILRQRNELPPKRQVWFRSAQPWTMTLSAVEPKIEKQS